MLFPSNGCWKKEEKVVQSIDVDGEDSPIYQNMGKVIKTVWK